MHINNNSPPQLCLYNLIIKLVNEAKLFVGIQMHVAESKLVQIIVGVGIRFLNDYRGWVDKNISLRKCFLFGAPPPAINNDRSLSMYRVSQRKGNPTSTICVH